MTMDIRGSHFSYSSSDSADGSDSDSNSNSVSEHAQSGRRSGSSGAGPDAHLSGVWGSIGSLNGDGANASKRRRETSMIDGVLFRVKSPTSDPGRHGRFSDQSASRASLAQSIDDDATDYGAHLAEVMIPETQAFLRGKLVNHGTPQSQSPAESRRSTPTSPEPGVPLSPRMIRDVRLNPRRNPLQRAKLNAGWLTAEEHLSSDDDQSS